MKFLILSLAFVLPISAHALSGGAVGNGGDTVSCVAMPRVSPFVGLYSLDYLMNVTADIVYAKDFEKVVGPNDSFDKNIFRILAAFKEGQYRVLHQDLKEFYDGLFTNEFGKRYIWKKAPYGVTEVSDEELRQRVPQNCLGSDPKSSSLIQTILRVPKAWEMQVRYLESYSVKGADYTYSTEVMSKLPPLQKSFLLFHEWLRNFTDDPETIRDANAIFHSDGWTGEDIETKMRLLISLRLDKFWSLKKKDERWP